MERFKYSIILFLFLFFVFKSEAQDIINPVQNISGLKGQKIFLTADSILVGEKYIYNGGGFMLQPKPEYPGEVFKITYWNDVDNTYRIFSKLIMVNGVKQDLITDVLQFSKRAISGYRIVEQTCNYVYSDDEILALVKNVEGRQKESFKVKRAWRANRKTGNFEKLSGKMFIRCGNESDGI